MRCQGLCPGTAVIDEVIIPDLIVIRGMKVDATVGVITEGAVSNGIPISTINVNASGIASKSAVPDDNISVLSSILKTNTIIITIRDVRVRNNEIVT